MAERSVHRTMNTDTFEVLQAAGFDIKQATVLATAIPDIEPPLDRLRAELRGEIQELRAEMDARFAELRADMERRLNTQTWTIVGTLVALGALLTATNLWG
ncbi:MAG: hypothetical protein OXG36_11520 [Caldilineaceae bacterium]|nr:hypothetical protein [Caldilineaceae bacterium]